MDTTVLYDLSYGMYVVGASDAGHPVGCIINTCIQITNTDPVLAVSLNKNNYTLRAVKRSRRFSLSVITEQTDRNVIPAFGFQCSRDCDKYAAFGYETLRGVPLVKGTFAGRMICEVQHTVDCGTHEVVFARLVDTAPGESAHPMTYEYYHKVVKGKAPKNAPTYRAEEDMATASPTDGVKQVAPVVSVTRGDQTVPTATITATVEAASPSVAAQSTVPADPAETSAGADYVCPVCGYVHHGEMSDEADSYVCPVCGMAGSAFEPKEE